MILIVSFESVEAKVPLKSGEAGEGMTLCCRLSSRGTFTKRNK